jgi:hypothetical protein
VFRSGLGPTGSVGIAPDGRIGQRWPCGPRALEGEMGRARPRRGRRGGGPAGPPVGFGPLD